MVAATNISKEPGDRSELLIAQDCFQPWAMPATRSLGANLCLLRARSTRPWSRVSCLARAAMSPAARLTSPATRPCWSVRSGRRTERGIARRARTWLAAPSVTTPNSTALAYGTLAGYQILVGDSTAGEGSFSSAKRALSLTDLGARSSATTMVYRDVSEAFWKVGDRARAVTVFNEGRAAGADKWPTDQQSTDSP
jgi:hypothetical protein